MDVSGVSYLPVSGRDLVHDRATLFPERVSGSDLRAYYLRVAPRIFVLVAVTYASFAFLMQPFIFRAFWPWVAASQISMAILALLACRFQAPAFHLFVIVAMVAQVIWRGLSSVIGS
ncbi:MAG TPA: hypothetical protein VIS76_03305 [Pseudomonadales bacterium]